MSKVREDNVSLISSFSEEERASEKRKQSSQRNVKFNKKVKYEDSTEAVNVHKVNPKHKQITPEELTVLKETENLYNSGLLRLQIEELLQATNIKERRKNQFGDWFQKFQSLTNSLPEYTDRSITSFEQVAAHQGKSMKNSSPEDIFFLKLSKCRPSIKCDKDMTLSLVRPHRIYSFGLSTLNAFPGPNLHVNVNIEIPKKCFCTKDYLNNRYFVKRYYYLLYIANYLNDSDICASVKLTYHQEMNLLPILQVVPKNCEKIQVSVFVTPEEETFKYSRFLPSRNNIKENVFSDDFSDVDEDTMKETPTLSYNSVFLHDMTLSLNSSYIGETLGGLSNIQEAVRIICIWAKQRELFSSYSMLTEELILFIVTYLTKQRKINKFMSSYQVVRTFWDFLHRHDLKQSPLHLCDELNPDVLVEFQNSHDIVMLDRTSCYNVAYFLNHGVYEKIRKECELALLSVNDNGLEAFHSLFITKIPIPFQYDLVINIQDSENFRSICSSVTQKEKVKCMGDYQSLIIKHISGLLRTGFNKRANLIVPYLPHGDPWIFGEKNHSKFNMIIFGINLDREFAFSYIERGPALNDPKEKDFREFWGRLSCNRRFHDGTACVTVFFKTKTLKDRRDIIKKITNYLIREKLQLNYTLLYNDVEEMLINSNINACYDIGTNEESTLKAIQISDDLMKKIRELDLSLSVSSMQGVSSIFSYSECYPPIQTTYRCGKTVTTSEGSNIMFSSSKINVVPKYVQPIECVLQLEMSSKWPNNLQAIRYSKTAFYLEISKLLKEKFDIISAVKHNYLDIFFEGLVFRFRLYVQREIALQNESEQDTTESLAKVTFLPKIRAALKGIHSQNPTYGPSTSLIKRWLNSHLLDNYHFPSIVVELLNASLYVTHSTYLSPQTPQIAFYRFLKFFSELHWILQPVVVNFNDMINIEQIADIETKFEKTRDAFPPLCIVSPFDEGCILTKEAPTEAVLHRVKKLSEISIKLFENAIFSRLLNIKGIFMPNMNGYDVKIHLKPLMNPRRHEQKTDALNSKLVIEAYDPKESRKMPIVDFNPVEIYVRELRQKYGNFASFFFDEYGGNVIAVLWKPSASREEPFKVTSVCGRKVNNNKTFVAKDTLIEDFYILGKDIIKQIEQ